MNSCPIALSATGDGVAEGVAWWQPLRSPIPVHRPIRKNSRRFNILEGSGPVRLILR